MIPGPSSVTTLDAVKSICTHIPTDHDGLALLEPEPEKRERIIGSLKATLLVSLSESERFVAITQQREGLRQTHSHLLFDQLFKRPTDQPLLAMITSHCCRKLVHAHVKRGTVIGGWGHRSSSGLSQRKWGSSKLPSGSRRIWGPCYETIPYISGYDHNSSHRNQVLRGIGIYQSNWRMYSTICL